MKTALSFFFLSTIWLLFSEGAAGQATVQNSPPERGTQSQEEQSHEIPADVFLHELGKKNDCYFTLEELWQESHVEDLFESAWIKRSEENYPLADVIRALQTKRPNFSFERDPKVPKVIHIVDARLTQLRGYSLDEIIGRFEFTGTTSELISALAKQNVPIQQSYGAGPIFVWDPTRISIAVNQTNLNQIKVRDVLTQSLPLGSYNHLVWKAVTTFDGDHKTYVQFYPQVKKQGTSGRFANE